MGSNIKRDQTPNTIKMRLVKYTPFIFPVIFSRNLPDAPEKPTSGHLRYPILEAFKKIDTDGNELISIDELRQGMAAAKTWRLPETGESMEEVVGDTVFGDISSSKTTITKEIVDET